MTTVNYTPDPKKKPQLTEEQEASLAALSDEDIDYSDIPELDDNFWKNAKPVTPDLTQPVTLRVKRSVLQYFQASGKKRVSVANECSVRELCPGTKELRTKTAECLSDPWDGNEC